ncbi:glycosyltransferase [Kitasatospora sp. NBC_01266]|uniref:glycosyltransferase n=1 Tax=Kitasatospora sp. NBC_01266 TaxID=2903572 RepID=UPI002E35E1BB|nr:glycosyltransferase [Kitasatospora sp. NBC_01266]
MFSRPGATAPPTEVVGGPAPARPGRRDPARRPPGPLPRILLPAALVLWLLSLRHVRLDRMGDLGLLQVLPALYWVALALLLLGFVTLLRQGTRLGNAWPAGYVLGLIAMIHATPSLLYPALRYSWAWKHVAVVDAMLRHNGTVPNAQGLEIYNQWPGFFQLNVLLLRVTGHSSALGYAVWGPVIFNVLLIPPLLLLFSSVTRDRRLVWGAVWIFFSASWVGQDYFSPQAFAFVLYVTVLAMVVRRLQRQQAPVGASSSGSPAPPARSDAGGWPWRRLVLVLLLEAAIVSSHQLTPVMLIVTLFALALPRRNRRVVLPVLAGALIMTVGWDTTVAWPYVSANLHDFLSALARPDDNAVAGLAGLGAAAPGQVLVAWVDRVMSAGILLLAIGGFVRRPWVRRTGLPAAAVAPGLLLVANTYGGEMIFRVYLFALPAIAFLAATLVLRPGPRSRLRGSLVLLVACGLVGGLLFGYDSKESMNYFTSDEVTATRELVDSAPPGARIVSVTGNLPGDELRYDQHQQLVLTDGTLGQRQLLVSDPAAALAQADAGFSGPAYLILTRGQSAECYLTGVLPADTVPRVKAAADASPELTPVYRGPDADVYRYLPSTSAGAP